MATRWGKRYIDKAAPRHEVMATETRVIQQIVATEEGIVVSESNIGDDAVSNAKLANMAQATFKMRAAGAGTGDPIDGTPSQAKTALAITDDANTWSALQTFSLPPILPSYTVATLPSAATYVRGLIYVSDGTANKRLAISDGTNWRFPDGNVVS